MTLRKSRVVVFLGSDYNTNFPNTRLNLWDDLKISKVGVIFLKEKIFDFHMTTNAILIVIPYRILIFDVIGLNYVCKLEDIDLHLGRIAVNPIVNPLILAHASWSNKSIIKINKSNLIEYKSSFVK
jgi:hypothetical protein